MASQTARSKLSEVQGQLKKDGFASKPTISDILGPLVQGAAAGIIRRDDEIQAEKKRASVAAAAEAKRLRKEQEAAEKLESQILEVAQSVARSEGLVDGPDSVLVQHLVKQQTIMGKASFQVASDALGTIANSFMFTKDYPPSNSETGEKWSLEFNTSAQTAIENDYDIISLQSKLDGLNPLDKVSIERVKKQIEMVKKSSTAQTDAEFISTLTPQNIQSKLTEFADPNFMKDNPEQRNRLVREVYRLSKLEEYILPGAGNPLMNAEGNYLSEYALTIALAEDELRPKGEKIFTGDYLAIAKQLLEPDPTEKTPVTQLNPAETVAERAFLQQKMDDFAGKDPTNIEAINDEPTEDQKQRLTQLNVQYDAFVQAGKITPAGEAVVKDYASFTTNQLLNEQTLLTKKKADLLTGQLLSPEDEVNLAIINTLLEAEQNMPKDATPPDWLEKDIPANINREATLNQYERIAKDRLSVLLAKIDSGEATAEVAKEYIVVNRRVGYLDDVRKSIAEIEDKNAFTGAKLTKVARILHLFNNVNNKKEGTIPVRARETEYGDYMIMSGRRRGTIIKLNDPIISSMSITDLQKQDLSKTVNRNNDFPEKLLSLRENASLLTKSSYQLAQFVTKNDSILSIGATTEFISKVGNSIDAAITIFTEEGIMPSERQLAEMANEALSQATEEFNLGKKIGDVGALYGQFVALATKHAFAFAKISLDTKGQAMSNLDYKNAYEINIKGSDYDSFMPNLMMMTQNVIEQAVSRYNGLLNNDLQHQANMMVEGYSEVFNQTTLGGSLESYLEQDAKEAYAWINEYMQTGIVPPKPDSVPATEGAVTKTNVASKLVPIETFFTDLTNNTEVSNVYAKIIGTVSAMGTDPSIDPEKATRDLNALILLAATKIYGPNPNPSQLAAMKGQLMAKFRGTN